MATPAAFLLRFGVFELDTVSGELRKNGLKIRLPEQSFQVLKLLLSRPGDVVTREELQQVLWTSDTFVDFEVGLNSAVRKLREALDDSAENPRFVETLPRRGYRFVGPVAAVDPVKVDADIAHIAGPTSAETLGLLAPGAITTTSRLRRGLWMAAGVMLVSMVAAAFGMNQRRVSSQGGNTRAPVRSLVVLPFENLTGDAAQAYFVDAVTDALTTHLAQVEGLAVISRTSARRYQRPLKRLSEIGEELNVKSLRVTDEPGKYVEFEIVPNFKALGPRLGKRMPLCKQVLQKENGSALHAELERRGGIAIDLPDGERLELSRDEIEIRLRAREGYAAASHGDQVVVLDTRITPELRREGLAREVVHHIQAARKSLDLPYEARIEVTWSADAEVAEAITRHADYIAGETLAVRLAPGEVASDAHGGDVEGEPLRFAIARAS